MKNLELKELGVQELDAKEMINVNGGYGLGDLLGAVFTALGSILDAVVKLVQGL
jgi:hypothetical protein